MGKLVNDLYISIKNKNDNDLITLVMTLSDGEKSREIMTVAKAKHFLQNTKTTDGLIRNTNLCFEEAKS